ncbi:MAG: FecR domain-containing protein [Candidatus Omnitrophica bacterium]|nr:FecR domain-containing protein [Candidatus Omnitrophota bacterium]
MIMTKKYLFLVSVFVLGIFIRIPTGLSQHAGVNPPVAEPAKNVQTAAADSSQGETTQEKSLLDHKAVIFNVSGEALILRKGDSAWKPLAKSEVITEGDQVKTGKDSFIEISYDEFYMNIARIGANTIAEFRSIEPTDIYISNGGIFNDLEGLTKGSTYEVATPTSVAGVRGTEFLRAYDAQTGMDTTICDRGAVDVFPLTAEGEIVREARVQVEGGKALEMNAQVIAEKNFDSMKPVEMTPEHHQIMGEMVEAKENLTRFVGDPQVLEKMHEMFTEMQKDPEKMARITNELREKDREIFGGPNGPNGPQGPSRPDNPDNPNDPNDGINPKTGDPRVVVDPNNQPMLPQPGGPNPVQNFEPNRTFEPPQNLERDYTSWEKQNFMPENRNEPVQPPAIHDPQRFQEIQNQTGQFIQKNIEQQIQQQFQDNRQNENNTIQQENRIQEIIKNISPTSEFCSRHPGAPGCNK